MKKGEIYHDKYAYHSPKTDSTDDQLTENNYGEQNHLHSGHVYA
jgi:hypothetical protein